MKTEDGKEGRNEKKRSWETAGRSLFMASQRFKASHARRRGIRRGDCCTEFWRFFMVSLLCRVTLCCGPWTGRKRACFVVVNLLGM